MERIVKLPAEVRAQLEYWAETGYPRETCGVLVGQQREGQTLVSRAVFARNVNTKRSHDRYELDARDLIAADQAAEADGLEIVGIWHTHPDHPACPSASDQAHAWRGWSYIIIGVNRGRVTELRSWRLAAEAFQEEGIES